MRLYCNQPRSTPDGHRNDYVVDNDKKKKVAELKRLLKQLEALADRARKPQFAPDDEDVYRFYAARVPSEVLSTRTFEGWWRKAKNETPDLLTMTRDDLLPPEVKEPSAQDNPSEWSLSDGTKLKLRYRYEPGATDDGVTVDVPVELLPKIMADEFDWLVPGLRTELVAELIRSLPKNLRRNVVPANDWAVKALATLPEYPEDPLVPTLAKTLRALSGTHMTAADFAAASLPTALRMTYRVIDEKGRTLGLSVDLAGLQQKFATAEPGQPIKKIVDTAKQQAELVTTAISKIASPADYIAEHLSKDEKLAIASLAYKNTAAFVEDVIRALVMQQVALIGLQAAAEDVAKAVTEQVIEECFGLAKTLLKISVAAREASKAISEVQDYSLLFVLTNEKNHIASLLQPNIVSSSGLQRITRIPVYLQASKMRIEKLLENPERDRIAELELNEALAIFEKADASKRETIRWMIEELRISLFAQSLGTAESVSVQRIKKALTL